jgi:hypothetical protein
LQHATDVTLLCPDETPLEQSSNFVRSRVSDLFDSLHDAFTALKGSNVEAAAATALSTSMSRNGVSQKPPSFTPASSMLLKASTTVNRIKFNVNDDGKSRFALHSSTSMHRVATDGDGDGDGDGSGSIGDGETDEILYFDAIISVPSTMHVESPELLVVGTPGAGAFSDGLEPFVMPTTLRPPSRGFVVDENLSVMRNAVRNIFAAGPAALFYDVGCGVYEPRHGLAYNVASGVHAARQMTGGKVLKSFVSQEGLAAGDAVSTTLTRLYAPASLDCQQDWTQFSLGGGETLSRSVVTSDLVRDFYLRGSKHVMLRYLPADDPEMLSDLPKPKTFDIISFGEFCSCFSAAFRKCACMLFIVAYIIDNDLFSPFTPGTTDPRHLAVGLFASTTNAITESLASAESTAALAALATVARSASR